MGYWASSQGSGPRGQGPTVPGGPAAAGPGGPTGTSQGFPSHFEAEAFEWLQRQARMDGQFPSSVLP